jgi:hypothetical protein
MSEAPESPVSPRTQKIREHKAIVLSAACYHFRIAAAIEELHTRCRNAKIFITVPAQEIVHDIDETVFGSPSHLLDAWFHQMNYREVAEAIKFALKQADMWEDNEFSGVIQGTIQFKPELGVALQEASPSLAFDKRELLLYVETISDFLGNDEAEVAIVGSLRQLQKADSPPLILRQPIARIRMEMEHRHHVNTSIQSILQRWFRHKTPAEIAELLCQTIDRFCPEMEKDYLSSGLVPKGHDNFDLLLQTEQILLEMGAHLYLESSNSLLDAANRTHTPAFKNLLDSVAPGYQKIVRDEALSSLKAQLQSFKRWRRLYIWSDVRMIVGNLPLAVKLKIIASMQKEVDLLLEQWEARRSRAASRRASVSKLKTAEGTPIAGRTPTMERRHLDFDSSAPCFVTPMKSGAPETVESNEDTSGPDKDSDGDELLRAKAARESMTDAFRPSRRSSLPELPEGRTFSEPATPGRPDQARQISLEWDGDGDEGEGHWEGDETHLLLNEPNDPTVVFDVTAFDPPGVPSQLMRVTEEKVVVARWPQYLSVWRRFKKFQKLESHVFKHSQKILVKHFKETVGNLTTSGLWNICQIPELIREAAKIRSPGFELVDNAPRTVRAKTLRIWQELAKWPAVLNLPPQLMLMSDGMLNGYAAGAHPDLPDPLSVLKQAKQLFYTTPGTAPPRPAPPVLEYHRSIPAGRDPNATFQRRTILAKWVPTHTASAYRLEYGRLSRRIDWRKCYRGELLPGNCLQYSIGLVEEEKLQEQLEYAVRLRAVNEFGAGLWVRTSIFTGRKDNFHDSRATSQINTPVGSKPSSRGTSPFRTPRRDSLFDGTTTDREEIPPEPIVWGQLKESLEKHLTPVKGNRERKLAHVQAVAEIDPSLAEKIPMHPPFQAFVGGLDYMLTEADVWAAFQDKCNIENVRLLRDDKNRSKGFCFIDLMDRVSLIACLAEDGKPLQGRAIKVNVADHPIAPNRSRSSRPNSRPGSRSGSPHRSHHGSRNASQRNSRNPSRNNSRRTSPERNTDNNWRGGGDFSSPVKKNAGWTPPRHDRGGHRRSPAAHSSRARDDKKRSNGLWKKAD